MKKFLKVFIWLFVLYGLFLIGVYFLQGFVLYPGQTKGGNSEWAGIPSAPDGYEYVQIPREGGGEPIDAFMTMTRGERKACLIWFHGAAENISKLHQVLAPARKLPWHVAAVEYPGFGASRGSPSHAGITAAAEAAYDGLAANPNVERDSIWVGGWSMGAAVALELAASRPVRGAVVFSPCTSFVDVYQARYPFIPVSLLLKDRYDARTAVRSMTAPLLVIQGRDDTVHPFSMARELVDLAAPRSDIQLVNGAGHTDVFEKGGTGMWDAIAEFVQRGGPAKR